MQNFKSNAILPFMSAYHRFLEILISDFTLHRKQKKLDLHIKFNDENLAIWSDIGKRELLKKIPNFEEKVEKYRNKLDSLVHSKKNTTWKFSDAQFPFRYASGGTLPIIQRGHKEYYCFFYRDIEPIGWNIANGGCDSFQELLNPIETIERELREELVAFNINRKEWLLFEVGDGEVAAK